MAKIIDTTDPNYIAYCKVHHQNNRGHFNGAYYYSQEIVKNIVPSVKTNRPWDTLGMRFLRTSDHAIVFLHHNLHHETVYRWLRRYRDLVLVCSTPATYKWAKTVVGCHAIFLPLSIDVDYVRQFETPKTKEACYAGNIWSFKKKDLPKYVPEDVDYPPKDIPREDLLRFVAPYKVCYAIGRSAMEAKCLGCEVRNCDSRYEGIEWPVLSNREAAKLLQMELDRIDRTE